MSYESSAPFYDLFGAKDDGAFLAKLATRCGGPALVAAGLTVEAAYADFAGTPFRAGDGQAVFVLK